jgi:hypothetical protein
VLTVLAPFHTFTTDTQMIEGTPAQYKAGMHKHAEKILGTLSHATQAAGFACETVQVEHKHPYQAPNRGNPTSTFMALTSLAEEPSPATRSQRRHRTCGLKRAPQ